MKRQAPWCTCGNPKQRVERGCPAHAEMFDRSAERNEVMSKELRCICAGQGGTVYSSDCPTHDHTVDTTDIDWQRRYEQHIEAQAKAMERLGW